MSQKDDKSLDYLLEEDADETQNETPEQKAAKEKTTKIAAKHSERKVALGKFFEANPVLKMRGNADLQIEALETRGIKVRTHSRTGELVMFSEDGKPLHVETTLRAFYKENPLFADDESFATRQAEADGARADLGLNRGADGKFAPKGGPPVLRGQFSDFNTDEINLTEVENKQRRAIISKWFDVDENPTADPAVDKEFRDALLDSGIQRGGTLISDVSLAFKIGAEQKLIRTITADGLRQMMLDGVYPHNVSRTFKKAMTDRFGQEALEKMGAASKDAESNRFAPKTNGNPNLDPRAVDEWDDHYYKKGWKNPAIIKIMADADRKRGRRVTTNF
jgi:hypothetical protein